MLYAIAMTKTEVVKIDEKGRVLIPSSFRDFLGIKAESEVLLTLDESQRAVVISPTSEKSLVLIKILMSDAPGSLSRLASVLTSQGVDLVSSESHSVSRGKEAEWRVVCSAASVKDAALLKKLLLRDGAVSVEIKKL